jgi:hypothetical protein
MSRNGSGTYTVPNTFVAGTTITASDHNDNWSDIGAEITNSVAADGQTSLTGPLKASSGTVSAPSLTFASDTDTGAYRSAANEFSITAGGTRIAKISSAGLDITSGSLLFAGVVGVTYANIQNVAASRLLGNPTGSSAVPSEISLAGGLAFSGTTIANTALLEPSGYLTLTSGTPVIASDVTAATAVYYTPLRGNQIPIYDGTIFSIQTFSELTLTLVANHLASQIYDVFIINDSGTIRAVTGPAWTTATAGSGARGTGAGTTELQQLNGIWTNKVSMTGRYGASTTTVAANCGTYVGSIFMDGTNGQISCHRTFGQSRKWGVWNAYNRKRLYLMAGDSTASWNYATNTVRASNNSSANSLTLFVGLQEETCDLKQSQYCGASIGNGQTNSPSIGIGYNSTSAYTQKSGSHSSANSTGATYTFNTTLYANAKVIPTIGINTVTALENGNSSGTTTTFNGGAANQMLSAEWSG